MRTTGIPAIRAALIGALVAAGATWALDEPFLPTPEGSPPAALAGVELPPDLLALAVAGDGRLAALGLRTNTAKRDVGSLIRLYTAGAAAPAEIEIPGIVRDLLFDPDGITLYVLQHRPAKKSEGETLLLALDVGTRKVRQRLHMPATACALESWPERRSLLFASRNDLRTLELPDLRSGPLFRVPGDNRALAAIDGNRVVVGQAAALLLVDLDDRPEPDGVPPRARIETPAAVVSLAVSRGGEHGLARLGDGRVVEFGLDPLELHDAGAGWIARLPRSTPVVVDRAAPTPSAPPPAAPPMVVEATPPELPAAAPPPAALPIVVEATPPELTATIPPPAAPPVSTSSAPPPPPIPPSPAPPAEPAPPSSPAPSPAPRRGTIEGAPGTVIAVVFLGPNSLLREAARVLPDADGGFDIPTLPPGRYRVQLDGGGGRALSTDPPFAVLDVTADGSDRPLRFRIVQTW